MHDIFPKFIIEDGNLIVSKVTYHHQIVTNKDKVQGGGWFDYNSTENSFTFFGESHDFGAASMEDIKASICNHAVFTNRHLTHNISTKYNFYYRCGSERIPLASTTRQD